MSYELPLWLNLKQTSHIESGLIYNFTFMGITQVSLLLYITLYHSWQLTNSNLNKTISITDWSRNRNKLAFITNKSKQSIRQENLVLYHESSGDGATSGDGDGPPVSSTRLNPNFLMSSFAISWFALSEGWYSSQNTYLLLSLHSVDAGMQVRAGRILPNEQQGESAFLNPTSFL